MPEAGTMNPLAIGSRQGRITHAHRHHLRRQPPGSFFRIGGGVGSVKAEVIFSQYGAMLSPCGARY